MQATAVRCGYKSETKIAQSLSMNHFSSWWNRGIVWYNMVQAQGVIFQVTPRREVEITFLFCTTMSDLDADLYGGEFSAFTTGDANSHRLDLYGNDGAEEQEREQEENDTQQPLTEAPAESPLSASIPTEQAPSKLSNIETIQPNGTTPQVPSSNVALSSQYMQQQAPQKIPTYEEPQPSEYREPQQVRSDGVYQNIPVNERSVRPSEMKDEG